MTLMSFSGAWGKMIHERNLKQKIPLKVVVMFSEREGGRYADGGQLDRGEGREHHIRVRQISRLVIHLLFYGKLLF